MKTKIILLFSVVVALMFFAFNTSVRKDKEPWSKEQLMEPADLAKIIIDASEKKLIIYSVGPGANIKGCIEMGAAQEKENLDKLKTALSKLDKNTEIVILCGCCPFEHCPNIRPSFELLNEMKFTNHKLLNLPKNLKVNWIDKGYPMND